MRPRTPLVSAAPMRSSEACTDEHDVERALSIRAHVVQFFSRGVSTSTQLNAFESTRCCNTVVLLHRGTQRHRHICSNDLTSVQVGPILFLERSCDSRVTITQLYASLVHGARRKLTEPVPWNKPVFMSPTVAFVPVFVPFLFHQLCVMSGVFLECSEGQTCPCTRNSGLEGSTRSFTLGRCTFRLTDWNVLLVRRPRSARSPKAAQTVCKHLVVHDMDIREMFSLGSDINERS
jgi:hypothetical protein